MYVSICKPFHIFIYFLKQISFVLTEVRTFHLFLEKHTLECVLW